MAQPKRKVPIIACEWRDWTKPVGTIVATHGLKGAVKVRPLMDGVDELFAVGNALCLVMPSGRRQGITVQSCYRKGTLLIVRFAEIDHIDFAESCIGFQLTVHKDWSPALREGEFFAGNIVGMKVVTVDGEVIGKVLDVMESSAHDLLVTERGLIPMVGEIVKQIDEQAHCIVIEPPKGLLEEVSKKRKQRWQK